MTPAATTRPSGATRKRSPSREKQPTQCSSPHAVRHLADGYRSTGRLAEAEACYDEALALYAAADEPPALDYANALRPMAILKESLGETDEARDLWQQAKSLYATVPIAAGVAECEEHLARLG